MRGKQESTKHLVRRPRGAARGRLRLPFAHRAFFLLTVVAALLCTQSGSAQGGGVPAELQAGLLAKLASYDRNFKSRARGKVRILLVVKPGVAKSRLAAATMASALRDVDQVGGLPHDQVFVKYEGAGALAKQVKKDRAAVVYITPGFDDELGALQSALGGLDVLSVSAVPKYVRKGAVLGFELSSGKPKILLNLPQAKRQNVRFKPSVLKLMKVYR